MLFGNKKKIEKQEKARKEINRLSEEIAKIWSSPDNAKLFDVNGSYTGNPEDNDVPVQDADDL